MAEATRTATFVLFKAGGIKGVLATCSSFTTGDTCTFTSGDNGMTTILWRLVTPTTGAQSAFVSTSVSASTVTFGTTAATVDVFAIGF